MVWTMFNIEIGMNYFQFSWIIWFTWGFFFFFMIIMETMHGKIQLWIKWSSTQWLCMYLLNSHDFELDACVPRLYSYLSSHDHVCTRLLNEIMNANVIWLWSSKDVYTPSCISYCELMRIDTTFPLHRLWNDLLLYMQVCFELSICQWA